MSTTQPIDVRERTKNNTRDVISDHPKSRHETAEVLNSLPLHDSTSKTTRVFAWERWLVRRVLKSAGQPPVAFEFWNGEVFSGSAQPVVKIRILDRSILYRFLISPPLAFGEGYMDGKVVVEGSLVELCEVVNRHATLPLKVKAQRNSIQRATRNARHHYDLGNDFYRLWLDPQLLYTCAYYPDPAMSLVEAQTAKMDLVCRKLRLRPGQSVVEAGCGWGALALHMAANYGVTVTACNVSSEQIKFAREHAKERGLADRVTFIEDDWRKLQGRYDAFASVGMLEHVGIANYPELGDVIFRLLKPDGLGLIHTIGRNRPTPMDPWVNRYIFPGAIAPDLSQMMAIFHRHFFSVLDVENLRLHYARTVEHWLEGFESHVEQIRQMFDERFVRMWRLYLASSIAAFRAGDLQLFQVVFAHRENNRIPWTRNDLFEAQVA
jgi:cyclopropane-fatty-acyl-phospholipid synthase